LLFGSIYQYFTFGETATRLTWFFVTNNAVQHRSNIKWCRGPLCIAVWCTFLTVFRSSRSERCGASGEVTDVDQSLFTGGDCH